MYTAPATLLPPPYSSSTRSPRESDSVASDGHDGDAVRHLDGVGVETVLGAMIEQKRRASQPSYPAFVELGAAAARDGVDADGAAPARAPTRSDVFVKAR